MCGRVFVKTSVARPAQGLQFRAAYLSRRALLPIDGFFEWRDVHGTGKSKQPHAVAMKDGQPFCLAAIWETWRNPDTGQVLRTFAVITCEANEQMGQIHPRMPVIIAPDDYHRWIGDEEAPADLLKPFPSELISRRVNSPCNDDPSVLDREGQDELPLT